MPWGVTGREALALHRSRALFFGLILILVPTALALDLSGAPPALPRVAEGFAIAPLAPFAVPTAITFGPGDGDGPDLYATTLAGDVVRASLLWTPGGPVLTGTSTVARGFSQPLGLEFDHAGRLFVADSARGAESGRVDGRVTLVEGDAKRVVVDGLPNGRHNTNNMRMGPDGRLWITNGNPNDNGIDGGEVDVHPYSGAILSADVDAIVASKATLHWRDAGGARIPVADIPTHPRNADFNAKVRVEGFGFRNVYDVAFDAQGRAYTATNGADEPSSQDALYRIVPGADHGYPRCFKEGAPGAVGEDIVVVRNPVFPGADCADVPRPIALLGWHVCATGLDVPPPGSAFGNAVYVAECGPFFPEPAQRGFSTHDTGHKVTRVRLDDEGNAIAVEDFLTGLALPTDAHFGPDGALYVADAAGVLRVSHVSRGSPDAAASSAGAPGVVVALPGGAFAGYATPVAAASRNGELTLVNGDIFLHNVVARTAFGPDSAPWCAGFAPGRCPLFWSELVGLGATTPVLGLENASPGATYAFYCTIHPGMRGTLVVLPEA